MHGDLDVAIAMAQRLEVYHGGDGAKAGGGGKRFKVCKKRRSEPWNMLRPSLTMSFSYTISQR